MGDIFDDDLFNEDLQNTTSQFPCDGTITDPTGHGSSTHHSPESGQVSSAVATAMKKCDRILSDTFGHLDYKGKQKEIIEAAISGSDVFVLAPTGMGKSLCFQIPAIAQYGVSVVVSPLLALMKNQVANLRRKGIAAVALTSDTPIEERDEIIGDLSSSQPKNRLLYTTPERLCMRDLMRLLGVMYENGQLARLVVDEAHCISEWGHDFREEYRKLGAFRDRFSAVPIMALTATATKNVKSDIMRSLRMYKDRLFIAIHPFNRANLFYEVKYKSAPDPLSQMADILEFIQTLHRRRNRVSSGIIYCRTRGVCDELSNYLRGKGLNARPYHRGISSKILDKTLKDWEIGGTGEGGIDVVCATIAFGMGIDKSDVRYIIHYDLPKSLEGYYQETGRAGRDGMPSRCILYYSREDALRLRKLVSDTHAKRKDAAQAIHGPEPSQRSVDSLSALINLAEDVETCRHISICRYFGEVVDATNEAIMKDMCDKMCDVCKYPEKTWRRKKNLSEEGHAAALVSRSTSWSAANDEEDIPQRQQPSTSSSHVNQDSRTLRDKNSTIGSKRRNGNNAPSNAKKSKYEQHSMPSALVTKPHSSVGNLRKPFKTPFKTPVEATTLVDQEVQDPEEKVDTMVHSEDDVQIVDNDLPLCHAQDDIEIVSDDDGSAELPEVNIELDASFSQKIPLTTRMGAFQSLRSALHRAVDRDAGEVWKLLKGTPSSTEARALIFANAAKTIEFSVHSMSATLSGYEDRVNNKLQAIRTLKQKEVWSFNDTSQSTNEDAEDAARAVTSALEGWKRRKG